MARVHSTLLETLMLVVLRRVQQGQEVFIDEFLIFCALIAFEQDGLQGVVDGEANIRVR